jgi:protein TonB
MLIRAAFVSILLHLLILSMQNPLDHGLALPGKGREGRTLTLALTPLAASDIALDVERARPLAPAPKSPPSHYPAVAAKRTLPRSVQAAPESTAPPRPISGDLPTSPALPSAELLRLYRLSLARSARHLKVYPSLARINGWEGTVVVTVMPTAIPGAPRVALEKSSGHALLDRQALEMVEQAVSQAVLPEGLHGQAMSLSLVVVYSQND